MTDRRKTVPKIGLEDELVVAGKDLFKFEQLARVPNSIERLRDVKKNPRSIALAQGSWVLIYSLTKNNIKVQFY